MILAVDVGTSKLCAMVSDEKLRHTVAMVNAPDDATLATTGHRHEQGTVLNRDARFTLLQAVEKHPCVLGHPVRATGILPSREKTYAWMNSLAAQASSHELTVDTHLAGTRRKGASVGAIHGIDHQNLGPAPLIRATMEGSVRELEQMWRGMGGLTSRRVVAARNAPRHVPYLRDIIMAQFGLGMATQGQIRSHISAQEAAS